MQGLDGTFAIVTGASPGIGLAVAGNADDAGGAEQCLTLAVGISQTGGV